MLQLIDRSRRELARLVQLQVGQSQDEVRGSTVAGHAFRPTGKPPGLGPFSKIQFDVSATLGHKLGIGLAGIPAIGIPLDANRCARWMDRAYETTFNMQELENLLH